MEKLRLPFRRNQRKSKTDTAVRPSGKRVLAEVLVGLAVLLLIATLWAWWHYIYSHPRRVFDAMLENQFKTSSVTRYRIQQNESQRLEQFTRLEGGAQHAALAKTTLSQQGDVDAAVTTETIGTTDTDYVRYTDIKTDQTNADGKAIDFQEVENIWGKSEAAEGNIGDLYGDVVLGVIPVGSLDRDERRELMRLIQERNVFEVDYDSVAKRVANGRPQYTYMVQMDAEGYVNMLKQFASNIGLTQLDELDASTYAGQPKLNFRITVDVWSRHLNTISYLDSNRVEGFGGYGVSKKIDIPREEDTIPVDQLQERIQNLQ